MDAATVLSRCAIFIGSTPEDFTPLLPSVSTRRYEQGEYLWHDGDPANWMYVVLSGEVLVSRTDASGNEYVIEVYVRGDALGQLPFFDADGIRFTNGCAGAGTECLLVPKDAVLALLRAKPQLMAYMLAVYSNWIRTRDMHASESAFQSLSGRVACKLVELGRRYGEPGPDGVRIPIRLTQETVANMLGASRENVSRALARLARQGEVIHQRGVLLIPKLDELAERYSDFEETPQGMLRRK